MLFALLLTGTVGLHLAILASQVLFLHLFFHLKLIAAINHSAEVWVCAVIALEESARVQGKSEEVALIVVTFARKSLVVLKSLSLSHLEGHVFDLFAEILEVTEFSDDFNAASLGDFLLTAGATQEGEADLEGVPTILEELEHTVGVEHVAAAKLHARLSVELTCEADVAKIIAAG